MKLKYLLHTREHLVPINIEVESTSLPEEMVFKISVWKPLWVRRAPKLLKTNSATSAGRPVGLLLVRGERFPSTNFAISAAASRTSHETRYAKHFIFKIMHTRWVFFTLALRAAVMCAALNYICAFYSGRESKRAIAFMVQGGLMREHQTKDNCTREERIIFKMFVCTNYR